MSDASKTYSLLKKVPTFTPKGREIVRFDIEKKQTIRNSDAKIPNTIPVKYLPKGFHKKCTDRESWERTEIKFDFSLKCKMLLKRKHSPVCSPREERIQRTRMVASGGPG